MCKSNAISCHNRTVVTNIINNYEIFLEQISNPDFWPQEIFKKHVPLRLNKKRRLGKCACYFHVHVHCAMFSYMHSAMFSCALCSVFICALCKVFMCTVQCFQVHCAMFSCARRTLRTYLKKYTGILYQIMCRNDEISYACVKR